MLWDQCCQRFCFKNMFVFLNNKMFVFLNNKMHVLIRWHSAVQCVYGFESSRDFSSSPITASKVLASGVPSSSHSGHPPPSTSWQH